MKMTAEEILKELYFDLSDERQTLIAKIAMRKYAKEKCAEQRRIIAGIQNPIFKDAERGVDEKYNRVINIREPEFD